MSVERLWVKLMGAFTAVIFVGVVVTVLLARQGTVTQVSHVMLGNRLVQPTLLQQALATYYVQQGEWAGLESRLPQLLAAASNRGMMHGMMGQMMGMFDSRILVLDAEGNIVAGRGDLANLPAALLNPATGWPIQVEGRRVGTLVLEGTPMTGADGDALVAGVTRSVMIAALLAALVAFVLGAVLIRQITSPLAALTHASQQIALGNRHVRVDVRSNDELGTLGQTFNGMVTVLEMQERLRRNLMADIAHELRTPLSGIQGTVEAMQDGVFPLTSENLDHIHEQVMLVNRLVEDLRTLANAEAGQLALQKRAVDLAAVIAGFRVAHLYEAQQKGIDLTLHIDEPLPRICADEERMGQILSNLLTNALRHTLAGGVVDLSLSAGNGHVEIAVVDSGEGIDPVDLPHVFDRFYRGDRSRGRQTGGSGLGLAIVRQLVEAHGGQIHVQSPPPGKAHGAGFYITLPVS